LARIRGDYRHGKIFPSFRSVKSKAKVGLEVFVGWDFSGFACSVEQAKNRRKPGETRLLAGKNFKNPLDRDTVVADTPRRASYCLPPRSTFRRSSPIRTPDKVSEEHRCPYNSKKRR
jgi:hypothetical protein